MYNRSPVDPKRLTDTENNLNENMKYAKKNSKSYISDSWETRKGITDLYNKLGSNLPLDKKSEISRQMNSSSAKNNQVKNEPQLNELVDNELSKNEIANRSNLLSGFIGTTLKECLNLSPQETNEINEHQKELERLNKNLEVNSENLIKLNAVNNEIKKHKENRPSLIDDFANPMDEMPSYMDGDD